MSVAKLAQHERWRGGTSSSADETFGELRPLSDAAPRPLVLSPPLLPSPVREWAVDISERLQVPLEMVATPAIVGLASLVGRRCGIHPKVSDDWLVVPNLWGAIVARPGMLKSPALSESLFPVRWLAAEARETHEARADEHAAHLDALRAKESGRRARIKAIYQGKSPDEGSIESLKSALAQVKREIREQEASGAMRRHVVNDTTTEKLGALLASNPQGLLLERDELAGWVRSLERIDRKSDREFFLEAWNGHNSFTYDRIGRGTVPIPALCLSIIGGMQPSKLRRLVDEGIDGGYGADGLIQRFQLLVWPEEPAEWRLVDRPVDEAARRRLLEVARRLEALPIPRGRASVPGLRFDDDAQKLFYAWLRQLEERIRNPDLRETPAFESHLAKYRSLVPSLALIFHLVESGIDRPVSLIATERAVDWCEYLEGHARKVYHPELARRASGARALAEKIREGAVVQGMSLREIYTTGWKALQSSAQVRGAATVLQDHGWLRISTRPTNGRPSQYLDLRPSLLDDLDNR